MMKLMTLKKIAIWKSRRSEKTLGLNEFVFKVMRASKMSSERRKKSKPLKIKVIKRN